MTYIMNRNVNGLVGWVGIGLDLVGFVFVWLCFWVGLGWFGLGMWFGDMDRGGSIQMKRCDLA